MLSMNIAQSAKKLLKSKISAGKIRKLEGQEKITWQLHPAATQISQSILGWSLCYHYEIHEQLLCFSHGLGNK